MHSSARSREARFAVRGWYFWRFVYCGTDLKMLGRLVRSLIPRAQVLVVMQPRMASGVRSYSDSAPSAFLNRISMFVLKVAHRWRSYARIRRETHAWRRQTGRVVIVTSGKYTNSISCCVGLHTHVRFRWRRKTTTSASFAFGLAQKDSKFA